MSRARESPPARRWPAAFPPGGALLQERCGKRPGGRPWALPPWPRAAGNRRATPQSRRRSPAHGAPRSTKCGSAVASGQLTRVRKAAWWTSVSVSPIALTTAASGAGPAVYPSRRINAALADGCCAWPRAPSTTSAPAVLSCARVQMACAASSHAARSWVVLGGHDHCRECRQLRALAHDAQCLGGLSRQSSVRSAYQPHQRGQGGHRVAARQHAQHRGAVGSVGRLDQPDQRLIHARFAEAVQGLVRGLRHRPLPSARQPHQHGHIGRFAVPAQAINRRRPDGRVGLLSRPG